MVYSFWMCLLGIWQHDILIGPFYNRRRGFRLEDEAESQTCPIFAGHGEEACVNWIRLRRGQGTSAKEARALVGSLG